MNALTLKELRNAVAGSAAAFRLTLRLEAVSPKVFPPTYEDGKYATEERIINQQKVPCVLLDSVPSQANRMELALQDAWMGGEIALPVVSADFSAVENPGLPKVTSLQAPHRIADAILRDSRHGDVAFRKSFVGQELDHLSSGFATPLLNYAPHCLVFGMWDSTGPRGGLGVKFARALVSEVIGVNAVEGVATSSRIDPLNIRVAAGPIYRATDGGWTTDESKAEKQGKKPVLFKNKNDGDSKKEGKPAAILHGNIPPSITKVGEKGGFTIDYAEQTTVLSLPALRRLRFPPKPGDKSAPESDLAARTYLAALALLGATLAVEAGYDLRSRCILRAKDAVVWQLLGKPGDADTPFTLDKAAAIQLYNDALEGVQKAKLPIHLDEIMLTPTPDLVTLVRKSMEIAAVETGGE